MAADRFAAGQAADGLVHHCLENGGGQVFLRCALVDQRLDVCFGENAAAGCDGINGLVISGIFVQSHSVCLQQCGHLVDEGAGTACADAVHPLFHVAALKINDLGVLAAQLDGHVRLRGIVGQRGGYGDHLLDEGNAQMFGQRQAAGTGDHGGNLQVAQLRVRVGKQGAQRLLDVGVVSFVCGKKNLLIRVKNRNLYCGGTDIYSETVHLRLFHM